MATMAALPPAQAPVDVGSCGTCRRRRRLADAAGLKTAGVQSLLLLQARRRDPTLTAAAQLQAARGAMHAFAISSVVNGTAVGTVAGGFYLAGIEQASDLRRALRGLNASIRDSTR